MRRMIIKFTLVLVALTFMTTGISWAGEKQTSRSKKQLNTIERGKSSVQGQTDHYNYRNRDRSRYHRDRHNYDRRDRYRDRHRDRRHDRRHRDRRDYYSGNDYRRHDRRHDRRHHYHGDRYCDRSHFGGIFVDPGLFFSFGWHDRW